MIDWEIRLCAVCDEPVSRKKFENGPERTVCGTLCALTRGMGEWGRGMGGGRRGRTEGGQARRDRIYNCIVDFKRRYDGISPTLRYMMDACDISTTSIVTYHLRVLEREGVIKRMGAGMAGIMVMGGEWRLGGQGEVEVEVGV